MSVFTGIGSVFAVSARAGTCETIFVAAGFGGFAALASAFSTFLPAAFVAALGAGFGAAAATFAFALGAGLATLFAAGFAALRGAGFSAFFAAVFGAGFAAALLGVFGATFAVTLDAALAATFGAAFAAGFGAGFAGLAAGAFAFALGVSFTGGRPALEVAFGCAFVAIGSLRNPSGVFGSERHDDSGARGRRQSAADSFSEPAYVTDSAISKIARSRASLEAARRASR
jgi:hypothetical protein